MASSYLMKLGEYIFSIDSAAYQSLSRTTEFRWRSQARVGRLPAQQFIGPGLGSCLSEQCANPALRVGTQVFTVVNDPATLDFNDFAYRGGKLDGYHQVRALPANTGTPVQYTGSTTGPQYDNQHCSALQVSWSVRPGCVKLDINSLGKWCQNNVFKKTTAHGVRKLVTDPRLLSEKAQKQLLTKKTLSGWSHG